MADGDVIGSVEDEALDHGLPGSLDMEGRTRAGRHDEAAVRPRAEDDPPARGPEPRDGGSELSITANPDCCSLGGGARRVDGQGCRGRKRHRRDDPLRRHGRGP
jgi:hypothetical protein